jgi:hypothetical protein
MPLLFAAHFPIPPCSPPLDLACSCCPLLSLFAVVVVCCHRCCRPPLPLSSSAAVVVHCRHLPPPQPSLPLRVSTVSCHPLLSIPFIVCCPISYAVVVRRCRCLPLPLSSTPAVFHRCSHHHHSAVSAISHCLLLFFPIAVCHVFMDSLTLVESTSLVSLLSTT